mmetsp:Transcript_19164/g.48699  ORF Transcript_19164/g.48699 Transcript_19164/m.48699 type:complete len:221 (-) Transcript_19164:1797-2459(-)
MRAWRRARKPRNHRSAAAADMGTCRPNSAARYPVSASLVPNCAAGSALASSHVIDSIMCAAMHQCVLAARPRAYSASVDGCWKPSTHARSSHQAVGRACLVMAVPSWPGSPLQGVAAAPPLHRGAEVVTMAVHVAGVVVWPHAASPHVEPGLAGHGVAACVSPWLQSSCGGAGGVLPGSGACTVAVVHCGNETLGAAISGTAAAVRACCAWVRRAARSGW